jgi:fructan beta-fructosidase
MATLFHSNARAGVVGYWRFEEGSAGQAATGAGSVVDSSPNHLNASPFNGPVYSPNVPSFGHQGADSLSMEFNGTSQRLLVPDDPRLQLTHSLTIEAFVDPRPLSAGEIGGDVLVRSDDRSGLDPYRLTMQFTGDMLFQIMDASGQYCALTAHVPFNEWHHVAGTLDDATGSMKLYVDGNLVASTVTAVRPFASLDPNLSPGLGIGALNSANPDFGPEYFNGFIDDVRLSDTALTPDQLLVPEPSSATITLAGLAVFFLNRYRRLAAKKEFTAGS